MAELELKKPKKKLAGKKAKKGKKRQAPEVFTEKKNEGPYADYGEIDEFFAWKGLKSEFF